MKRTFILLLCFIAFAMACQDDNHTDENPMVESYVRDNFFNPNFISSNNEYIGNASTLKSSYTITVSDLDIEFRDQIMNYYQENLDFAQQVKDKVGLPVWDYTIYNTYDVDKLAFIPCARENSNYTEGVIIILHDNATGKLLFNYTDRYNFDAYLNPLVEVGYDNVPDRTYIMSLFLLFDKQLFNYVDCDILSEFSYLMGSERETGIKSTSSEQECRMELVKTEIDWWVDGYVKGEIVSHTYSHSTTEYNFELVCRDINQERQELPWGNDDGGGGPGLNSFLKKLTDKYANPKLPIKMTKQMPNTCVTSIMEYVNNHFCGGSANEGDYIMDYLNSTGKYVIKDGVSLSEINDFVKRHFNTADFSSYKNAINNGNVVMTSIISSISNSVHNVLVVGYRNDGSNNYIYMDPEKGTFQEAPASKFTNHYNINISSCK